MTDAYPLHWPDGWPRTDWNDRSYSRFAPGGLAAESRHVINELDLLGARNAVVSTDVTLRNDGLPYSNQKAPDDPGVAVYFTLNGKQQCIPCDRWYKVEENCRAIWKSIAALRSLERWGAKSFVDAAFSGFEALPAPGVTNWRHVLGSEIHSLGEAEATFKRLAKERHPDKPAGSDEAMADLNLAIGQAREEFLN